MNDSTPVITLGERRFPLQPFTLDQLRVLLADFARLRGTLAEGGFVAARDILATALADQIAREDLENLRTTVPEVLAGVAVIARVSGIDPLAEAMAKAGV